MFDTTTNVQSGLALSRVKAGCLVGLIFLLVAGLVSFQRMTNPAFGAEGDLPFHYYFTRAFNQSLSEGDWLPRWAGLLEGGRGNALFTFYPPFCFLLSAGLARLFKTDLVTGLKLTTFLCLLLAQLNAYLFARVFFPRKQSLLAAAAFVLLPAYPLITLNRALLPCRGTTRLVGRPILPPAGRLQGCVIPARIGHPPRSCSGGKRRM